MNKIKHQLLVFYFALNKGKKIFKKNLSKGVDKLKKVQYNTRRSVESGLEVH